MQIHTDGKKSYVSISHWGLFLLPDDTEEIERRAQFARYFKNIKKKTICERVSEWSARFIKR